MNKLSIANAGVGHGGEGVRLCKLRQRITWGRA